MTILNRRHQEAQPRAGRASLLWPHVALGAFVVLWLDVGVASPLMASIPGVAKAALLGLWLAVAGARSLPFISDVVGRGWPLGTLVFIAVLYREEVPDADQYIQGLAYLGVSFALFCFYSQDLYRRERNVLVIVMVGDFAITGVRTLFALQVDPLLSRYLATTDEIRANVYGGSQSFLGLGGYGYAYSLAALIVVLMYFMVRFSGKLMILVVAGVGVCSLIVVEMAFTTSIVLVAVLGGVFLVQDGIRKPGLRLVLYAVVILGWLSGFYSAVLRLAANVGGLTAEIQVRLLELATFLDGGSSAGSDLGVRLERWTSSLQLWLSSGVFGLSGRGGSSQEVGGHSQWLDLLASYGLWTVLLGLFFFLVWTLVRRRLPSNAAEGTGRGWLFMLILGLINTLLFSTLVLTWVFLLPALAMWMDAKRRDEPVATL